MQHFGQDSKKVMHQPKYKNANERVHIITGQQMDRNGKNAGYERYTEKP